MRNIFSYILMPKVWNSQEAQDLTLLPKKEGIMDKKRRDHEKKGIMHGLLYTKWIMAYCI